MYIYFKRKGINEPLSSHITQLLWISRFYFWAGKAIIFGYLGYAHYKGILPKTVPRQVNIHLYENVCMAQRLGFRTGRALEQLAHLTLTPSNISPPHPPSYTWGSSQAHLPGTHPHLISYPVLLLSLANPSWSCAPPPANSIWGGKGNWYRHIAVGMGTLP